MAVAFAKMRPFIVVLFSYNHHHCHHHHHCLHMRGSSLFSWFWLISIKKRETHRAKHLTRDLVHSISIIKHIHLNRANCLFMFFVCVMFKNIIKSAFESWWMSLQFVFLDPSIIETLVCFLYCFLGGDWGPDDWRWTTTFWMTRLIVCNWNVKWFE